MSYSYAAHLCRSGRIEGAFKLRGAWVVPSTFRYHKSVRRKCDEEPWWDRWTEAHFQSEIIKLARELGWEVYHTYNSRKSRPGFSDLVMVRERVLFRELKTQKGRVSPPQARWLRHLREAGADAQVWRPRDWDRIAEELSTFRPGGRAANGESPGAAVLSAEVLDTSASRTTAVRERYADEVTREEFEELLASTGGGRKRARYR